MAGIVLRGEVRTYLDRRETMKAGAELSRVLQPSGRDMAGVML